MADDLLGKLRLLCHEAQATHDDLTALVALGARVVEADTCSIMLVNGEGDDARVGVAASFGPLPPEALAETARPEEGLAGVVLASGTALAVPDIAASPYAHLARRPGDPRRSLAVAPMRIEGRIVGTVNASCRAGGHFGEAELVLLETLALLAAKSVQLRQLRGILASRFTQLALSRELQDTARHAAYQKPDQIARLLARSFYREMTRAGFASGQIVQAASEIIAQLNSSLARHSARERRREP